MLSFLPWVHLNVILVFLYVYREIHLSNSDVAMLKLPVLLATAEFDLVYTPVYMYTVKLRFLKSNACNGQHSPVSIR